MASSDAALRGKYDRWMSAWPALSPSGRSSLSSLQEVEVSYFAEPSFEEFSPGKVAVLPTVPFMLYWYLVAEKRVKHQFNFIEACERGRNDEGRSGVFVDEQAKRQMERIGKSHMDYRLLVVLKIDSEELWVLFQREDVAKSWKDALSALLNSFFQGQIADAPATGNSSTLLPGKKSSTITETLGLLFDISASQKTDERNSYSEWTSLKVTFLQVGSNTREEYFLFDRSQSALESSSEEVLTQLREKLDAGNLAIFSLYLEELTILEYERRKKTAGHEEQGWVCRDLDTPEAVSLCVTITQITDFRYVMQQYRKCDAGSLKQSVALKCEELQRRRDTPLRSFFSLSSLYLVSAKVQLTELATLKYGAPDSAKPPEASVWPPVLSAAKPNKACGKWYKESCDCTLS